MIQLTPEAMDLFQAGVEDRPGVAYQCTCAQAPPPSPGHARAIAERPVARHLVGALHDALRHHRALRRALPVRRAGARRERRGDARRARSAGRPARARTTASCRCSRRCGAASRGRAMPTTSTCSAISRATVAPRPFWASLFGAAVEAKVVRPRGRRRRGRRRGRVAARRAADARHVDWLRSGAGFDERSFGILWTRLRAACSRRASLCRSYSEDSMNSVVAWLSCIVALPLAFYGYACSSDDPATEVTAGEDGGGPSGAAAGIDSSTGTDSSTRHRQRTAPQRRRMRATARSRSRASATRSRRTAETSTAA